MTCWWCHWGWPKLIADIYDDCVMKLGGDEGPLHWGPAHIVWEDENWEAAQWCLDHFDEYRRDYSDATLAIVRESLDRLVALPDKWKREPIGYGDDSNAPDYPPPDDWIMVHR